MNVLQPGGLFWPMFVFRNGVAGINACSRADTCFSQDAADRSVKAHGTIRKLQHNTNHVELPNRGTAEAGRQPEEPG